MTCVTPPLLQHVAAQASTQLCLSNGIICAILVSNSITVWIPQIPRIVGSHPLRRNRDTKTYGVHVVAKQELYICR